jgi:hypothetical protein
MESRFEPIVRGRIYVGQLEVVGTDVVKLVKDVAEAMVLMPVVCGVLL